MRNFTNFTFEDYFYGNVGYKYFHKHLTRIYIIGKWWLVGSSWTTNLIDDPPTSIITQRVEKIDNSTSSTLLKLAKEQKMNTDIRRSIFVIIMSSEVNIKFNDIFFLYLMENFLAN